MASGDYVTLSWEGKRSDGEVRCHAQNKIVTDSAVGRNVTFSVGAEHITVLKSGKLKVFWRADGIAGR